MDIFHDIIALCIANPDMTFNIIVSTVVFLGMVDTVHDYSYPGGVRSEKRQMSGHKLKALGYFILIYIGNTFRLAVIATTIVAAVSTFYLFIA